VVLANLTGTEQNIYFVQALYSRSQLHIYRVVFYILTHIRIDR